MRDIPSCCEYIEGIPYNDYPREYWGGGLRLKYCPYVPLHEFSIFGISPLYLCRNHLTKIRQQLIFYVDEMSIHKLQIK